MTVRFQRLFFPLLTLAHSVAWLDLFAHEGAWPYGGEGGGRAWLVARQQSQLYFAAFLDRINSYSKRS